MKRRILALLLVVCLLLQTAPVFVGAAQTQKVTVENVTVNAGYTASVTIWAEDLVDLATFEVYLYYDPSVFTVSSTSNGNLLSGSQASVNTTQEGTIKLAAMSLDGISGSGSVLTVWFSTAYSTVSGTYPISVAVGNAYNTDLSEATIDSESGSITVQANEHSEYFYIYGERSASTLQKDDSFSYWVYNSNGNSFVSGEFTFTYDYELFEFDSVTLSSALTGEGAIWSVNSSVLGQVRIAYANENPVNTYLLFTVNMKVIGNEDTTTTVTASATNMYKADLSTYLSYNCSSTMWLQKLDDQDDPNVWLETSRLIVGQPATSLFWVEKGAGIAAADFTVTYDPAVLRCTGVTVCDTVAEKNGMVIVNDNFAEGKVRFSYINMDAYDAEDFSIVEIGWEPLCSPNSHYQLAVSGVGVVDADQKEIPLEYLTDSDCVFVQTVVPSQCLVDGYTDHVCACGENYQTDTTEKLGHDIQNFPAQAVTCTEIGWDAYVGCSRCTYGSYVEIPALGHDEIAHAGREVTCTEIGWEPYVTCSRCDYNTYQQIPALGHRVIRERPTLVDPLEVKNDGTLPFEVIDGTYYSQNHTDNSSTEFTVTALYDCEVTLIYSVSSETNCDKLHILHNGSQLDVISGTITNKRKTVDLTAGDVLTVRYSKDVSVRNGEDRGWLRMEYELVSQMMPTLVPAEEKDPTCTEPVVCDQCGTQVKETLPHEEIYHEGHAPSCEEGGWADYVTCAWCDYTTYRDLAPLGHDYYFFDPVPPTCTQDGVETSGGCTRCNIVIHVSTPALGHDITSQKGQAPTCAEAGWYSYESCSRCDYTTYQERPALGHSYGAWTQTKAPTCLSQGAERRSCIACDHFETRDVAALGHDLVGHSAKEVTCTNIGWNAFDSCSRCDYTTYQEIPALGHSYGTWTQTKAPACLNKGAERRNCDRCDYFETRDVAALGHDVRHHSAQSATCTEIGWNAYDTCSRCDYTTYTQIPATGHTPGNWITDREATYEADGSKHKACTVCKTVLETSIIPALTHTYVAVVTAPTCTEQGYTTYTCADCGNSYVEDYVPALGHSYGQWTQVQAPGCETQGAERRDCEACDHYETRVVSATGHTESDWIVDVEATCTETGTKQIACVTCGTVMETQMLPKLGHDEQIHAAQAPTCAAVGWEAYVTCSRCEYTTYTQIAALSHQWLDRQETEERLCAQAPDCTGYNTYWYGCSRCGEVSDSEYFVGTVKGPHSFTEQVEDDAHRVPGTVGQYYYDCVHCDTMGSESFSDALPGDVDRSGTVDVDDAIYLLQHVLMPDLFPVSQPVDVDKSGVVDVDDAIYLLQHVLMPDLFPL